MISGPMGGVAPHRFRDESSNTNHMVTLSNQVSSILVIDKKKVFERPLNHTRTKITANLVLVFFMAILDQIVAIFRCSGGNNELLASSLIDLIISELLLH